MEDFIIQIQTAILDDQVKKNIDKQLKQMTDFSINIDSATLDSSFKNSLQNKLNSVGNLSVKISDVDLSAVEKKIQNIVGNANFSMPITINTSAIKLNQNANIVRQAANLGTQAGQAAYKNFNDAISNVSSAKLGKHFIVDPTSTKAVKKEMENLVGAWTSGKGSLTDVKIQTRTVYDKETEANITRLHKATVTYKNEVDEVIKKEIAWRQIGTTTDTNGNEKALYGFVEATSQYSKSLNTASDQTNQFVKKQKEAVASQQNTLKQLTANATNKNNSRPITSEESVGSLNLQIQRCESAMEQLRNATVDTFDDALIKVKEENNELKILTKLLRDADNISLDFKGTDIEAGKKIAKNRLEVLKSSSKEYSQMTATISTLENSFKNVNDNASLAKFNDELRVAKSELNKVIAEANTLSKQELLKVDVSSLQTKINNAIKHSTGLTNFEAEINGAKVSTNNLLDSLSKVQSAADLKLVNRQWAEFVTQAKNAGIVVKQTADIEKKTEKVVSMQQRLALASRIVEWNQKNTKATKEVLSANEAYVASLRNLNSPMLKSAFNDINQHFKDQQIAMREAGKLGKSLKDSLLSSAASFSQLVSVSSLIMDAVYKIRQAATELKDIDSILTEISKTSDLTKQQLRDLGASSFEKASELGRKSSDYLTAVQEMSRSGFYGEQGEGMARQSLLAQTAGDMDATLANQYILATNAAYKFQGNAEKVNEVLDGMNMITNRNSVAMADMAESMSIAGSVAATYRVDPDQFAAMTGTIEAVTKLGGNEVGTSIKALLINLQNVTSSKIVNTLDRAGASMTTFVDGTEKLRKPTEILKDLSETFKTLDEDDPLRAEILTNIGQKFHATKLAALLENYEMYEKMLVDYSEGEASAFNEAQKSANNWEGSLNKLSNTWTSTINNIANSDAIITAINLINELLGGINALTDALGSLGSLGLIGGIAANAMGLRLNHSLQAPYYI